MLPRVQQKMQDIFHSSLPESLFKSHYELAETYGGSHLDWKNYLKDPDVQRFIESEIASITEIAARTGIQKLASGQANSSDVQAVKELLAKSRIMQEKTNQRPTIILTYLAPKEEKQ